MAVLFFFFFDVTFFIPDTRDAVPGVPIKSSILWAGFAEDIFLNITSETYAANSQKTEAKQVLEAHF